MWDLIVSVPDHCLSFYFLYQYFILKLQLFNSVGSTSDGENGGLYIGKRNR